MCGRFVTRADAAAERYWSLVEPWERALVQYNVAPGQEVPVILGTDAGRAGRFMRWGLVPRWARGETPRYHTFNARAETLHSAASYRGAWRQSQRCIVPAVGFYEWQHRTDGKQPWFIAPGDRLQFGLAGLWERSERPDGHPVVSCTIVTCDANCTLAAIHAKQRMPVILPETDQDAWLRGTPDDARALLRAYPDERLQAYPVSRRVNSTRNDGPDLTEPLTDYPADPLARP